MKTRPKSTFRKKVRKLKPKNQKLDHKFMAANYIQNNFSLIIT